MKMQAVLLNAIGDENQFVLGELPVPQPQVGQVRIRIKVAAFNPVDVKIRMGMYGGGAMPMVLGADCSGVIDALGEGVSQFAIGDEVYAMSFGPSSNGSYAQYLCIPVAFVCKKPKNISFEQAASLPLVSMTAYRAMVASGALNKKGSIFIAGAGGGVGSIAVQLAQHFHGGPIFTIAGSEESKEAIARNQKIPANQIQLYKGLSTEMLKEKMISLNGNELFSATFDFVGKEMKKLCLELTGHSGHFSSITPEEPGFEFPVWTRGESQCFGRNMNLHFIFVGSEAFSGPAKSWSIYQKHLSHITELVETNAITAPQVKVVGHLSVQAVQEAHRLLQSNRVKGKLAMTVS
ncbi:MAG: NADP-dependent oxidoreductase [Verrucomicrobia bacterium]|nr:NADP-dependent oxidoreductase [Verrucomicrobiota bacterium]